MDEQLRTRLSLISFGTFCICIHGFPQKHIIPQYLNYLSQRRDLKFNWSWKKQAGNAYIMFLQHKCIQINGRRRLNWQISFPLHWKDSKNGVFFNNSERQYSRQNILHTSFNVFDILLCIYPIWFQGRFPLFDHL